jgi:hypothetical protein
MKILRFLLYFISSWLFLVGLLVTKGLTKYFNDEGEYVEDVFTIDRSYYPRRSTTCLYSGYFKSINRKASIPCDVIDSLLGTKVEVYNLKMDLAGKEITRDIKLYRHVPEGGAHIYIAKEDKYCPGANYRFELISIPTLLLCPLVFLLLTRYIRLRWYKQPPNTLGIWLLALFALGSIELQGQADGSGDTLYTFSIAYIAKQTIAMDVVRYEDLALKKTAFDTTRFKLQYPEECLLCEISATDEATLAYCHENDDIQKNPNHYTSIAKMSPDDLYLQPTLKLVHYFPGDTLAWIKLYFVDNVRGRKIRAVKQMEWSGGRWQLSAEKLDADLAFALSGIRDEVLEAIFLRQYGEDHELFAMQEACFSAGVFNLRALAKAYQSWFLKGKEQTAIIEKYGENLIQ